MMWLVIPFKGKDEIKQRLSSRLTEQQRSDLAFAMFASVLSAFDAFAKDNPRVIERVLIVSRDVQCLKNKAIAPLNHLKTCVFQEPKACNGLNDALVRALTHAESKGAKRALILHADLPLIGVDDVSALMNDVANTNDKSLHIVQDKSKTGTNALMSSLPLSIELNFGVDSCQKHFKQAMHKGLPVKLFQQSHFAFDVDETDDLDALLTYNLPENNPVTKFLSTLS